LDPDGTYRTYLNGELIRTIQPNGDIWTFYNGQATKLKTKLDFEYEFTYEPGQIRADLINTDVADADTPIRLVYDSDFRLQWMKRKNDEIFHFTNSLLSTREVPGVGLELYSYVKDDEGRIVETRINQDDTQTILDGQGNVEKVIISPTLQNPVRTEIIFVEFGDSNSIGR